jgi:beta-fructofuranosidase
VTGFRDPSVIEWPEVDRLLGRKDSPGLYALISGGVQDLNKSQTASDGAPTKQNAEGPRLFLYDVDRSDMTQWRFLSTLSKSFPRNLTPHSWTGDFGTNWECATVFNLQHDASGVARDVCILGVEGGSLRKHVEVYRKGNAVERAARYAHWFFASLKSNGSGTGEAIEQIDMEYAQGGLVDWGELYAFATFRHRDGRRIALGWLVELDLADELAAAKGWTGCFGLPRELGLVVLENVVGTLGGTAPEDVGSFQVSRKDHQQGARVTTMSIAPLQELDGLRVDEKPLQGVQEAGSGVEMPECYELHLITSMPSAESSVSLTLRATEPNAEQPVETVITLRPADETITIHRGRSSARTDICLQDEVAPFTLLCFDDDTKEDLDMRVFVDRDVIELFVNSRVALSTRVYAPAAANRVWLETGGGAAIKEVRAWSMGSIGLTE